MYLSTVLDDYSRYIIAWKLCTTMKAEDVTDTLDIALAASGCDHANVLHRPRLLSDNGPSYIAGELADYLDGKHMDHVRGAPFLLLITLVTSFVVYKKWWRGFTKPLRKRDARTWWGDFHRLAGVWSLWFAALITLTSIWYFVESLGGDAPPHPSVDQEAFATESSAGGDFAASIASAKAAYPNSLLTSGLTGMSSIAAARR